MSFYNLNEETFLGIFLRSLGQVILQNYLLDFYMPGFSQSVSSFRVIHPSSYLISVFPGKAVIDKITSSVDVHIEYTQNLNLIDYYFDVLSTKFRKISES